MACATSLGFSREFKMIREEVETKACKEVGVAKFCQLYLVGCTINYLANKAGFCLILATPWRSKSLPGKAGIYLVTIALLRSKN